MGEGLLAATMVRWLQSDGELSVSDAFAVEVMTRRDRVVRRRR